MEKTFFVLKFILVPIMLFGQADTSVIIPKRNTIYIEAFGQGLINSISVDRLYRIDHEVKTSFTFGFIVLPVPIDSWDLNRMYGIPISYNWLFGQKKSHLEIGAGLTYLVDFHREKLNKTLYTDQVLYMTPKISYRFQNPEGGLFFRISFTPPIPLMSYEKMYTGENKATFIGEPSWSYFFPWGGISLGYTFK